MTQPMAMSQSFLFFGRQINQKNRPNQIDQIDQIGQIDHRQP